MKKIINQFKTFITRGNVIDLAVGVIIGGAFTSIVNGLTQNILQPLINWVIVLIGGKNALAGAVTILMGSSDDLAHAIYINWGAFITSIINFFLIAVVLFFLVKLINKSRETTEKLKLKELEKYYTKHPDKRPIIKEEPPKETQEDILKEIRDLLKKSNKQ